MLKTYQKGVNQFPKALWLLPLLLQHANGCGARFVNGTQIVPRDEFTGELLRGRC